MSAEANPLSHLVPGEHGPGLTESEVWGNFQLRAKVGRGAFGEVYRAWDTELHREVALKLLLPRSSGDEAQFERLLREARALASVRHPNIVSVYGVSQHDGLVGFWTDFVQGKTLTAVVREQGTLGYREAALIGLDVCKALSAVHRAGLLHRDIKAENVMREDGGRILLMDFGLSMLPQHGQGLAGTPQYMAPELFMGAPASAAADIYAVGILLFYLVTGQYPGRGPVVAIASDGTDSEELTAEVIEPRAVNRQVTSRSVLDFRPDLPESYVTVVNRAIDPDPARRYQTAGALSTALSEALAFPVSTPELKEAKPAEGKLAWGRYLAAGLVLFFVVLPKLSTFVRRVMKPGVSATASSSNAIPEDATADYEKANTLLLRYDKRKNVTDAVTLLQGILQRDPNFALAQADLGKAFFLQYRVSLKPELLTQARAACNRAIELDANLAPPYITLARIEARTGNTALATQQIQKAMQLDPRNADAWGAQAEVYDAEGRSNDAITSVQGAIDRDPDNWRWPVLLGSYYFGTGKLEPAAEQFRKGVELAPDNSTALRDLGLVSIQLKRLDDAKVNLEKAFQVEPNFEDYSALAELYAVEGKYAQSAELYRKAADLNPTNYRAWGNLGSAYLDTPGDRDKALDAYRKAIVLAEASRKLSSKDPLLLANLGAYYAVVGRTEPSLAALRQSVALAPKDPDVLFQAGDGYEILGRREDAIRLISQSIALGFHSDQLERSPELASLRVDARFQEAVRAEQASHALDNSGKSE